jgi:hypothetical protein
MLKKSNKIGQSVVNPQKDSAACAFEKEQCRREDSRITATERIPGGMGVRMAG